MAPFLLSCHPMTPLLFWKPTFLWTLSCIALIFPEPTPNDPHDFSLNLSIFLKMLPKFWRSAPGDQRFRKCKNKGYFIQEQPPKNPVFHFANKSLEITQFFDPLHRMTLYFPMYFYFSVGRSRYVTFIFECPRAFISKFFQMTPHFLNCALNRMAK